MSNQGRERIVTEFAMSRNIKCDQTTQESRTAQKIGDNCCSKCITPILLAPLKLVTAIMRLAEMVAQTLQQIRAIASNVINIVTNKVGNHVWYAAVIFRQIMTI